VWAREVPPDPSETAEALRWNTVVPFPADQEPAAGVWNLGTTVLVDWGPVTRTERQDLSDRLDRILTPLGRTWREIHPPEKAQIVFDDHGGEGEGYTLTVEASGAVVGARDPSGRFYALVTLAQLLPPSARSIDAAAVAAGQIADSPVFDWRGLMLDSSRHFQSVETIEWVLELMALHKLNRFHWHLTDDQGWRLEVPGWPKLTTVGAWRTEAGRRIGGFYTAEEVRRIVAFAARRRIIVIPEVDLPGHAAAALAAYPELSATGAPREVPVDWAVADGVLSIGRATVTQFTDDVLATLVDLFPGPWIHWGGDEVYRHPWLRNSESLQWMKSIGAATAEQAVAGFWVELAKKTLDAGKLPIAWDEVSAFPLPPGTVVQWWDDPDRALAALKSGHPIIASWKNSSYLDYPEWLGDGDRADWMPVQPLSQVAGQPFWPPGTPPQAKPLLWGLEAGLWTERAPQERLGPKLFPRLSLVAELAWRGTPGGVPGWERRIAEHRSRLEAWGVGMPPPVQ